MPLRGSEYRDDWSETLDLYGLHSYVSAEQLTCQEGCFSVAGPCRNLSMSNQAVL
jgi:hypothetical protein